MLGKDSLLYFVVDKSVVEILDAYANKNNLWMREADDIVDLYACNSRLAMVEKSLLDESLYGYLREVFVEPVTEEFMQEFPDWEEPKFEYRYVVFGQGRDIPDDMKRFFIEVNQLTLESLSTV